MTEEEFAKLFPNVKWPHTYKGKRATHILPTELPELTTALPEITPELPKLIARYSRFPLTENTGPPPSVGSISNYQRTPRQRLVDFLSRTFYDDDRASRDRVEFLLRPIDVSPAAIPDASYNASRALTEGRYKDAFLPGLTLAAPFAGKLVKVLPKSARRNGPADEISEDLESSAPETRDTIDAKGPGSNRAPDTLTPELKPEQSSQHLPTDHLSKSPSNDPTNVIVPMNGNQHFRSRTMMGKGGALKSSALDQQASIVRTTEAAEESLSQIASNGEIDWENILFEEPGPDQFWASRSTPWLAPHPPLRKTPREFTLDYTNEVAADEAGNLLKTIDGDDLTGKHIAGRRKKGEKDQGLTPDAIRSIVQDDLKIPILRVPKSELPGRAIGVVKRVGGGPIESIKIWDRLPKDQSDVVLAHEFGHVMDILTGMRRTRGYTKELDKLYSENMTGQLNRRYTPKSRGYDWDEYRRERMAEAFRTASVNPNTIKSIAPKTAAFLREITNKHPVVSKILQINGIPLGITTGVAATAISSRNNPAQAQVRSESANGETYASTGEGAQNNASSMRNIASALLATGVSPMRPIPDPLSSIARILLSMRDAPVQTNLR